MIGTCWNPGDPSFIPEDTVAKWAKSCSLTSPCYWYHLPTTIHLWVTQRTEIFFGKQMVSSFISAFTKVLNIITYKTNISKVQNISKVIRATHRPLQTVSHQLCCQNHRQNHRQNAVTLEFRNSLGQEIVHDNRRRSAGPHPGPLPPHCLV